MNNLGTTERDEIDVKIQNLLFDLSKPSPSEVCGFYPQTKILTFTPNIFI